MFDSSRVTKNIWFDTTYRNLKGRGSIKKEKYLEISAGLGLKKEKLNIFINVRI